MALLCEWAVAPENAQTLPPLLVCGDLEGKSEKQLELASDKWWASLRKKSLDESLVRRAYSEFKIKKRNLEAERAREIQRGIDRELFLSDVLEMFAKEQRLGPVYSAGACQMDLSALPATSDTKQSCELSLKRKEASDQSAVLALWASLFNTDQKDARGVLTWSNLLIDSISRDAARQKKDAEDAANLQNEYRIAEESLKKKIPSMSPRALCSLYSDGQQRFIRSELLRRSSISAKDWALIDKRNIAIGMSELALICALGEGEKRNRSVGSWGEHVQYVYGRGLYIYVQNGVVTSWQD